MQCNSSKTVKANDQVISLPKQTQCKSSKTATPDDQVIPLTKQMDHPQTSLPMQKKDKPCPFIVRRGWCIKGKECDFSHVNVVNNLDLRKPVKMKKVRDPKPFSFSGNWQRSNIISLMIMNQPETSLQEAESTQTLHKPYPFRLPAQPRYIPSRAVYPSPKISQYVLQIDLNIVRITKAEYLVFRKPYILKNLVRMLQNKSQFSWY